VLVAYVSTARAPEHPPSRPSLAAAAAKATKEPIVEPKKLSMQQEASMRAAAGSKAKAAAALAANELAADEEKRSEKLTKLRLAEKEYTESKRNSLTLSPKSARDADGFAEVEGAASRPRTRFGAD
jgi:hypothetical protein